MPGYDENTRPNDLFGVFHEEASVYVGDPFTKGVDKSSRSTGKSFGVPFQPKGTGRDAMIDKTTLLSIPGDIYIDPMTQRGPPRTSIHPKAFVPVGGSKKPSGAGSIYGLLGPASALLDTDASLTARTGHDTSSKGVDAKSKRNIYASPAKKGGFGFPYQDRTIGGNRFEFVPDEYCRGRILEKDMKKAARALIPKAFVSTGRTGRGIVPIAYTAPAVPPSETTSKSKADESAANGKKPWKTNNPPAKGQGYGCLSRITYVPCPEARKAETAPVKAFKHVGGTHKRLSMWSPNPYAYAARPAPDNDLSLLG